MGLLLEANRRLAHQRNRAESALISANDNLYDHRVESAFAELSKNNMVRAEEMLDTCPEDRRDWEWHYVRGEIDRHKPDQTLSGHRSIPRSLRFSPKRHYLALGYYDGTVLVWETKTWTQLARFRPATEAKGVRFTHDGRGLIVIGRQLNRHGRAGHV